MESGVENLQSLWLRTTVVYQGSYVGSEPGGGPDHGR